MWTQLEAKLSIKRTLLQVENKWIGEDQTLSTTPQKLLWHHCNICLTSFCSWQIDLANAIHIALCYVSVFTNSSKVCQPPLFDLGFSSYKLGRLWLMWAWKLGRSHTSCSTLALEGSMPKLSSGVHVLSETEAYWICRMFYYSILWTTVIILSQNFLALIRAMYCSKWFTL